MKYTKYLIICFFSLIACSKDDDDDAEQTLEMYIGAQNFETGAVIACAASDEITNDILIFFYPEVGATDIQFYQTLTAEVDSSDFSNYRRESIESEPFFNGYLGRFTQTSTNEKWIIITFELDNEIKISNPIRSKQIIKPSVWSDTVLINHSQSGMPSFSWTDNLVGDNAIYFQVISDAQNNLLSGTYTFENNFQYYNTSNVVLNITTNRPPSLILDNAYNFTLMDVSEDNWVNRVILKTFIAE